MADELRGWHPDPFHAHELRYFSLDGKPTRLVSDAGRTSHDPPLPAPPRSQDQSLLSQQMTRATAATRPVLLGISLPTVRDRSAISDVDYAVLPIRGAPVTHVNSAPNNVEGSQEITTASALPRPSEIENPPVELHFVELLLPSLSPGRRATLQRFLRYGSVSAVSTVTALAILVALVGTLGYPAIWSNVVATGIATILSFELNRRWVWAHNHRSLLRQALPYFILSLVGLLVSTYAISVASDATMHASRVVHTAGVELADAAAFGSLWLVQFFLCDRLLFRPSHSDTATSGQDRVDEGSVKAATVSAPSAEAVAV